MARDRGGDGAEELVEIVERLLADDVGRERRVVVDLERARVDDERAVRLLREVEAALRAEAVEVQRERVLEAERRAEDGRPSP